MNNTDYEEIKQLAMAGESAKAMAAVMAAYDDIPMADIMNQLSAQLDFYDDTETDGAIHRTYTKLDAMIKDRRDRRAERYVDKLTDDMIKNFSNGCVIAGSYSYIHSRYMKRGLFDPAIFGGFGDILVGDDISGFSLKTFGTNIGHMELPCRVILKSSYGIIGSLFGILDTDIEKVVNGVSYINKQDHRVVSEKEYKELSGTDAEWTIGADGIYEMLKALNYEDKPERLAFQVIPVISPVTRPMMYSSSDGVYHSSYFNTIYEDILTWASRVEKLQNCKAPDIIMRNEKRILNQHVNTLVTEAEKCITKIRNRFAKLKGSAKLQHDYCQFLLICRHNILNFYRLPDVPATEITSLNLFPEQITLKSEDMQKIDLEEVIRTNDEALAQFDNDHMMVLPDDVDPDHLPDELQAEADIIQQGYDMRVAVTESIWSNAEECRENCTVVFNNELHMYEIAGEMHRVP